MFSIFLLPHVGPSAHRGRRYAPADELWGKRGRAEQVVRQHEQPTTDFILASPRTGMRNRPRLRAFVLTHSAVATRCL